ncbi:hypothetical protein BDK51DRAFT_49502, partial [Blyttiomyces helicus]
LRDRFPDSHIQISPDPQDFRLIDQVAEEIWIVQDGEVEQWQGDIRSYKDMLKEKIRAEREAVLAAEAAGGK